LLSNILAKKAAKNDIPMCIETETATIVNFIDSLIVYYLSIL
jgi:hypothetical protein